MAGTKGTVCIRESQRDAQSTAPALKAWQEGKAGSKRTAQFGVRESQTTGHDRDQPTAQILVFPR